MTTLRLTTIGTSTDVVIPKETMARLQVSKGDSLYAVEMTDGYLLTPDDPAIEEQLRAGQNFLREFHDTFNALAK